MLEVVAGLLPKNPVVIQAGYYPDSLQKMFHLWPAGRFHIFEPNPEHFQQLKKMQHYYPNAEIFPLALAEMSGLAPFYVGTSLTNSRIGSLLPSKEEWKWHYTDTWKIMVECRNLQEWARAQGIQTVDFIWLDMGGMELAVLKTIPHLIEHAKVVLLETYEKEFRCGMGLFEDVVHFLDQRGLELIHQWKVPGYQGYSLFMKQGLAEVIK
jgi:FkbM family methyltransferase